jgi:LmbE family N-acetylglucosaminyl deacetylase
LNRPRTRKQQLLRRHRRNKRVGLLLALVVLVSLGVAVAWWLPLVLAVLGWIAHEAWFADHLFYSPRDDYQYSFPPFTQQPKVHLNAGRLRLDEGVILDDGATLILALRIKSTWLGRFIDPLVELSGGERDLQTFERGVNGLRYLNLSEQGPALSRGELRLRGRHCRLQGDADGAPTWNNLLADLRELLLKARPEVIVLPHPTLDPHPDHLCAHHAVLQALEGLEWQPTTLLGYANHLHDNDRWPMGDAGTGIALPPYFEPAQPMQPVSLPLALPGQRDKAMALGLMHDLQPRAPFKRRLRRGIQRLLAGRTGSPYGENEFFRKAVRRHELFWRL